ncbi:MAG: hypothetical protein CBB87_10345 [Micavibrio sp. TMED27]|mgnify:CR=1 FL=1|nr:hypothetical protein [Micavibrio sp.]OUT90155.1 MAG: hypothetical protein CBB87_10345 [Micavibrio sp. TMED27]|tara:strand:+ start:467 stop:703 length:237 start_codon:yes stop_codon:yes gene_type:complete
MRPGKSAYMYHEERFGIIEEFSLLSPRRKAMLFDHIQGSSDTIFERSVRLIWPDAKDSDVKKLRSFLVLLKHGNNSVH